MSPRVRQTVCLILVPLFLCAAGCGRKCAVHGTVKFRGRELEKGYITFFPADKVGNTVGGEIVDGHYSIPEVPAGKKRVLVTGELQFEVVTDAEHPKGVPVAGKGPNTIPPSAPGNNQTVDVGPGDQELDFDIKAR